MGFLWGTEALIYQYEFEEPDRCEECYEKWLESDDGAAYVKRVAEVEPCVDCSEFEGTIPCLRCDAKFCGKRTPYGDDANNCWMDQLDEIKDTTKGEFDEEKFDEEKFEEKFIKPLINKETFEKSQGQW